MIGFIFLHRDLLEWEWYQNSEVSRLFIHLLLKANFAKKKWQGIVINRGQLVTSTNSLSAELKLSIQQVRTALYKLEEGKYIEKKATNNYTLITLVDYDKYQSSDLYSNERNGKPKTDQQHASSIPLTITKKRNNTKNNNNETIETRRETFKKQVFEHSQYSNKILDSFFSYWSEFNTAKTKMKFESHREYFEIEKRLKKWLENEWKTTNKNPNQKNTISNR